MSNINRPHRLLDGLADIVTDLYGENAAANARLAAELRGDSPTGPAAPADPVYAARPALPDFIDLWKVADEPIDWTEALTSAAPQSQPVPMDKWRIYHRLADDVLHGDPDAYLTVLRTANPMADLMPYVASLDVSTVSGDELCAAFSVRPDLMDDNARRYLSGMALRIARDLFAVLPVTRVSVQALRDNTPVLEVPFERRELHKVRFAFIDPVSFVEGCGGTFADANA